MTDTPAPQGHNNPPDGDSFAIALEEKNQDLWRRLGDLEMRRLRLPKQPATEEEAQLIIAWAADSRALAREFETRRVEVKAPYLEREKQIDTTFNNPKRTLLQKTEEIEQRNAPYLRAKRERERAEAEEKARLAREAQERAATAAREAREAEDRAAAEARRIEDEARQREADRVRQEDERRQQAAADAQHRAEETQRPQAIDLGAAGQEANTAADNEAAMRKAHEDAETARKAREAAEAAERRAGVQVGRADKKVEHGDTLGKVSGAGANQRANMVWVAKVDSWPKVMQSLGPLASFLNEQIIRDAIARAARHPNRPEIPGVTYSEELEVKTTATRS